MASKPTQTPEVLDRIHFDTLLKKGEQVVRDYASKTWTDLEEHDPGITLLQTLSYGVSDLAYRHTLPLEDLLTPESGAIFSEKFAPEHILTSGPITEDDYRRVLLDLHSTGDSTGDFYFRNVQLKPEPADKRHRYWYDPDAREFLLVGPTQTNLVSSEVKEKVVVGGFTLYVEPNMGMESDPAKQVLTDVLTNFLHNHRNLCEEVREIIWVKPDKLFLFRADIELEDDCQNPEEVMAQILTKAQSLVCPVAQHVTVNELAKLGMNNEAIYQGPQLKHGYIPELPQERDYATSLNISVSPLVNQLLAIPGVKRIQKLGFCKEANCPEVQWDCTIKPDVDTSSPAYYFPQIWQGKTFNTSAEIKDLSEQVRLFKRGQRVKPEGWEGKIWQHIKSMRSPLIQPQSPPPFRGRWRNPGDYHKASQYLPLCYGVHEPEPNNKQKQLRRFLLPFEQQLADGCAQLALLPALLSFERGGAIYDGTATVWGHHVKFLEHELDVELKSELTKDEKDKFITFLISEAQDIVKERAIINYLLSYFGTHPISKVLLNAVNPEDFLSIQRGYLAQQGELGYERASIEVNAVSALQRRIAAKLGVGAKLFYPIPKEKEELKSYLTDLPFYVVEHRALLPKQSADVKEGDWIKITNITKDKDKNKIKITKQSNGLIDNQYINLKINTYFFIGVNIEKIDNNIEVQLDKHEQLEAYINKIEQKEIDKIIEDGKAFLETCSEVTIDPVTNEELTIGLGEAQTALKFEVGQLIDLQILSRTIFRLKIYRVEENYSKIVFKLSDNNSNSNSIQLKNTINNIKGGITKEMVHLYQSVFWLKEKSHAITFVEDKKIIKSDIYPIQLKSEDTIDIVDKYTGQDIYKNVEIDSVDPEKNTFTVKKELDKIDESKHVFYIKKDDVKERFTFTISVVFNQEWLKDVNDPYITMEWVRNIVSEEIPSHITAQIHWLPPGSLDGQFSEFGKRYAEWQNGGAPYWGEASYKLLSYLGLGELPAPVRGIGMMMISAPGDKNRIEYIGEEGEDRKPPAKPWDDKKVEQTGLFFVPKGDVNSPH